MAFGFGRKPKDTKSSTSKSHTPSPSIKSGPASSTRRYDSMVNKVNKINDIKKLKKIIYNRNHTIRHQYEKEHPEYKKQKNVIQFPPIEDLRLITQATFNRLDKIKNQDELIKELRKLIINTTRRKNKPQTTGDFSNREQEYLQNGVYALREALSGWNDPVLNEKLKDVFDNISIVDINNIFSTVPSYWAISAGYYYAVADFDDFMDEIYNLIEKSGVQLTDNEKHNLENRMFTNDPREHIT